jgi:uncharacterized protein YbaR (Trm112 family)
MISKHPPSLGIDMRRDLLDILACPVCKGDLALQVENETKDEIMKGELKCKGCSACYPIEDGIPNMLPQDERP